LLNKYTTESKRNDLGLALAIFAQAFQMASENKIIRSIFLLMPTEYRINGVHKLFMYRLGQAPSKFIYTVIVPPIKE
jgi:hypothetical protein